MKHISLVFVSLLSVLLACGQNMSKEEKVKTSGFEVNQALVDELFVLDQHDQEKFPFKKVESQRVDLNGDGQEDEISLYVIDNWGDPGNFQKIKIELAGQEAYEYYNYSGWVTFNENYSLPQEIVEKNQLPSSNMLMLDAKHNSKIILLFGWVYASKPGLLTIIDPSNKSILFNRNWNLKEVSEPSDDGLLELVGEAAFKGQPQSLQFTETKTLLIEDF